MSFYNPISSSYDPLALRLPVLISEAYYDKWKEDFLHFLKIQQNGTNQVHVLFVENFDPPIIIIPGKDGKQATAALKNQADWTEEEKAEQRAPEEVKHYLKLALPPVIFHRIDCDKNDVHLMWRKLERIMPGSETNILSREVLYNAIKYDRHLRKEAVKELKEADGKIVALTTRISELEISLKNEQLSAKKDTTDQLQDKEKIRSLTQKVSDLEQSLSKERLDFSKERTAHVVDKDKSQHEIHSLLKKVSDLEKGSNAGNKEKKERKELELRCTKLSKQNSDFEKVLFLEKERIEKERADNEKKCKSFEANSRKLSKKISELEKELDAEREELEKRKKADFLVRSTKDESAYEKKAFQQEIRRLTKNLATLSSDIMKEKRTRSDIQRKFDRLSKERNVLFNKVKELEAASSLHSNVSFKGFDRSKSYQQSQIRPSNLFYDSSVDKPPKFHSTDLPTFKKVKMEWREKGTTPVKDATKSYDPKGKTFVKPRYDYSANHILRLARKNICCSFCGTNDFVRSEKAQFWYGSYYISSNRNPLNTPGPKFRWVPKST